MKTRFLITALLAVISLGITPIAALSQKQPVLSGTLKAGGVSSRNMELIDVVSIKPTWHDQFETIAVTYPVGNTSVTKHFIIVPTLDSVTPCIKLVDVTDPRHVNSNFLVLYAKYKAPISSDPDLNVKFEYYQVYKDQKTAATDTYKGDVFLVVWVGDVLVKATPETKARFMIFNLTKACALRASASG